MGHIARGRCAGLRLDAVGRRRSRSWACSSTCWRRRCWPSPIFFYVVVYTLWLKRRTPQNIVIGGLAGALPPAIGWAAVTGIAVAGAAAAGGDHLPVDAAAFLGAVAVALATTMPAPACRCCRWCRASRIPAGRSCSTRWCWCRWACCRPCIGLGGPLYLAGVGAARRSGSCGKPSPRWRETRRGEGAGGASPVRRLAALSVRAVRRPDRRAAGRHSRRSRSWM